MMASRSVGCPNQIEYKKDTEVKKATSSTAGLILLRSMCVSSCVSVAMTSCVFRSSCSTFSSSDTSSDRSLVVASGFYGDE